MFGASSAQGLPFDDFRQFSVVFLNVSVLLDGFREFPVLDDEFQMFSMVFNGSPVNFDDFHEIIDDFRCLQMIYQIFRKNIQTKTPDGSYALLHTSG